MDAADRELSRLDRGVGTRVAKRIRRLADELDDMRPERLGGGLVGLYKLRVGDYRVIYEVLTKEHTIVIHAVGHRREIYRKK
ncbi:MAG: type II toxin-antitoxin system RelE/ParE family toxin [bacterium]|nr:type II toxin-antitoxin system RelE/ParE family toxin [bacterium]